MAFGDVSNPAFAYDYDSVVTINFNAATEGNLLIVAFKNRHGTAQVGVSDFTRAILVDDAGNSDDFGLYYKISTGGETSALCTGGGTDAQTVTYIEIEGPFDETPLDDTDGNIGDANPVDCGVANLSVESGIAVAAATGRESGSSFSNWTNSFNEEIDYNSTYDGVAIATLELSASGNTDTDCTDAGTDDWIALIATFKGVAGVPAGSVCWGHVTGVTQANTRTFLTNWTGTGTISLSGDDEKVELATGEYVESEVVNIGVGTVTLALNDYKSGDGVPTVSYKDGDTVENCEADTWTEYTVPFVSEGYTQVRLEV